VQVNIPLPLPLSLLFFVFLEAQSLLFGVGRRANAVAMELVVIVSQLCSMNS
jgi:hypothetical protein